KKEVFSRNQELLTGILDSRKQPGLILQGQNLSEELLGMEDEKTFTATANSWVNGKYCAAQAAARSRNRQLWEAQLFAKYSAKYPELGLQKENLPFSCL